MKKIFTSSLALLCLNLAFAQDSKTATASSQAGGNDNWTATNFSTALQTSDDSYVQAAIGSNKSSRVLSLTGFGFNIPNGAIISGISVSVERHAGTANKTDDVLVKLIVGGTQTGNNKAAAGFWPTADASVSYGAANDKWGIGTITPAQLNAADFGLAFQAESGPAGGTAFVDAISVTVFYSVGAPLPVTFDGLKASQTASGVNVQWSNLTETDVVNYSLERSANGREFSTLAQITPSQNKGNKASYQYVDASPLNGTSYYRIKSVELSGKTSYSAVARMSISGAASSLLVYPNPVKGRVIGLQVSNLQAGSYSVRIFNNSSQVISSKSVKHAGGSFAETISLSSLQPGVYTLEISGEVKLQKQFIVQ